MSMELLYSLNGDNRGLLYQWLTTQDKEPAIAWYPSAGHDFRDLLYLSPQYQQYNPASAAEPQSPDIFLHTDYFPDFNPKFFRGPIAYYDSNTAIIIEEIEELPNCDLPIDRYLVNFAHRYRWSGKVFFMHLKVKSRRLGSFNCRLIYVVTVNETFCAERILPANGKLNHIVHIRYGGGCGGGGSCSGIWLLNVLNRLQCQCFITDNHLHMQRGDERAIELYPELGIKDNAELLPIREIPSDSWSGHGDVSWNLVRPQIKTGTRKKTHNKILVKN